MLLKKPDFIILDEPTNHLDLDMIEWLEEYFRKQDFTIFMVTHDRYFLERVCNEIVELEDGKLYTYKDLEMMKPSMQRYDAEYVNLWKDGTNILYTFPNQRSLSLSTNPVLQFQAGEKYFDDTG